MKVALINFHWLPGLVAW